MAKKSAEQIQRDETKHKEKFDDYKESLRELNRHYEEAFDLGGRRRKAKEGGERRKLVLHLEELENMKSLRHDELGKGTLYISLCKKLNEGMLAQYHRWIFENHRWESVKTLKEFVLYEAEFQTVASETIQGVTSSNRNVDSRRNRSEKSFFVNAQESEIQKYRPCKVCKGHHGVWRCDKFKDLSVQERWNTAKRLKLCFRCLGGDHRGQTCVRTRVCGINNCKDNHNRLLHVSKEQTQAVQRQPVETGPTTDRNEAAHGIADTKSETKPENEKVSLVLLPPREPGDNQAERSHTTTTAEGTQTGFLALRTVPVILKNGNRAIKVNALLDEASTKTYINADVASELRLQGISRKVSVNVLNGQTETFETMPVDVELESLDGSVSKTVSAFTTGSQET